jgi:hypothetical protein
VNLLAKDSSPELKRFDLWFLGLQVFVLEPLFKLLFRFPLIVLKSFRFRSLNPVFIALRDLRYILTPNPRCSVCGQKVKRKWIPIQECLVDPILDETAKPFDPTHIGCKYCDPFFEAKSICGDIIIEEHGRPLKSWRN